MSGKKPKLKFKKHKYRHNHLRNWKSLEITNTDGSSDSQNIDPLLESTFSFLKEKYINRINYFSQVREYCLGYLQKVIADNCLCCDYFLSKDDVSSLTKEVEQCALLACLELKIYQKSIIKIVSDIEKCTQKKAIHEDVQKLLSKLNQKKDTVNIIKTENSTRNETENCSEISRISDVRTDNKSPDPLKEKAIHNKEENHNNDNVEHLSSNANCVEQNESPCLNTEIIQGDEDTVQDQEMNEISAIPSTDLEEVFNRLRCTLATGEISLAAFNQVKKVVMEYMSEYRESLQQNKIEKEKADIAKILNDENSDENSFDNLSEAESESKENINDINFLKSMEKMKELFSPDEEEPPVPPEKPKLSTKPTKPTRRPRSTIWKHEKIIQLHKFSMLCTEMSFERQIRNKRKFLQYFGEDSDEEHVEEYCCVETYRNSCVERISSWVVKYLMPYYHSRKIISREVFKTLAHCISEAVIDKIQYPDEWTIRYFVTRFFPPRKKYICNADVFAFQFD